MKHSFMAFHFKRSATFPLRVFVEFFCAETFKVGHVMFHVKNKKKNKSRSSTVSLFSSVA